MTVSGWKGQKKGNSDAKESRSSGKRGGIYTEAQALAGERGDLLKIIFCPMRVYLRGGNGLAMGGRETPRLFAQAGRR